MYVIYNIVNIDNSLPHFSLHHQHHPSSPKWMEDFIFPSNLWILTYFLTNFIDVFKSFFYVTIETTKTKNRRMQAILWTKEGYFVKGFTTCKKTWNRKLVSDDSELIHKLSTTYRSPNSNFRSNKILWHVKSKLWHCRLSKHKVTHHCSTSIQGCTYNKAAQKLKCELYN